MKKLSTIIIAMALVLGLGQCKKQETPTTTDLEDGLVYITVNVGDNGAKHEVYPNTGAYVFTNGDTLYVGNNGHYVGKLGYKDGTFSGTITSPSTEDYLHFYFLGGLTPSAAPTAGSTTDFTVSIADQSSKLPILSYGQSTQKYTDANATYSTILRNKCGLVKFVPQVATSRPVTVSGMKTTATIDFAAGGITPTGTTGDIMLHSESDAAKWAVLLQQDAVDDATVTISGYEASVSVPTITNNYYNNSGVGISMTATIPEGTIAGLFSVSADKQVYFSKGNLKYSNGTWSFHEHQYDRCFIANGNASSSYTSTGTFDLFGWGTSGYNHNNAAYQPWSTSTTNSDYYAYGNMNYNLYDQTGEADWGYNAISNGGNTENSGWRTLTMNEWSYVFNQRTTTSGIRWAFANVNDVNGVILLPDNWNATTYAFNSGASFSYNIITADDWANVLEANGAVFLPVEGYRSGVSVYDNDYRSFYWSASKSDKDAAPPLTLSNGWDPSIGYLGRLNGCLVRLVRDKELP